MNDLFGSPIFDLFPEKFRTKDSEEGGGVGALKAFWDSVDTHTQDLIARLVEPFEDAQSLVSAQGASLHMLAWSKGLPMPDGVDGELIRRLMQVAPDLQKRIGTLQAVEDAIFIMTGLSVTVTSPWSSGEFWVFGVNHYGTPVHSSTYRASSGRAWVFGVTAYGSEVGEDGLDAQAPYEMHVNLALEPTEQERRLIDYAAKTFGRAIDIPVILYPEQGTSWIIGEPSESNVGDILSVVLPSGERVADGETFDFVEAVDGSGSRIGIDTVIASPGFIVGEGMWGVDVIGSPQENPKTIRLPDGTTVEDIP